jgi:hypothetical protein
MMSSVVMASAIACLLHAPRHAAQSITVCGRRFTGTLGKLIELLVPGVGGNNSMAADDVVVISQPTRTDTAIPVQHGTRDVDTLITAHVAALATGARSGRCLLAM